MSEITLTRKDWDLLKQVMRTLTWGKHDASVPWFQIVESVESRIDQQRAEPIQDNREPDCIERWPECESGCFDPRCCRWPKSCSCA